MPRLRILSKDEWGGEPTRRDMEEEILEDVEVPAKYVIISATCTRPCVAREDCAILMRVYQRYFLYNHFPDVPFNFLVGPGSVVLEGRGWLTNCVDYTDEDEENDSVWNNTTEIKAYPKQVTGINTLKKLVGFKKRPSRVETKKKVLSKIESKKVLESQGEVQKKDENKYFGKSIVIGLISDVSVQRNPSSRALSTAFRLIKHGIRNNYIDKKYRLKFNFDPFYRVDKVLEFDTPNIDIIDPREVVRSSVVEDFIDHLMFPSMNPQQN